jgi:AraC-like DNA-binding protein
MPLPEPSYFSTQVESARRFYLPIEPASSSLSVAGAGREQCRPDYDVQRSNFPFLTMEFVARGEGVLELAHTSAPLQAGVAFIYDRSVPHRIRSNSPEGMTKYFVLMRGTTARAELKRYRMGPGSVVQVSSPEKVREIFEDLVEHGFGDHPSRADACAVTLAYLLMKMGDLAVPYGQLAGASFSTYQRCRQFMEEHFLRLTTVQQTADECHVDPAYMCRLFRRFGRQSPYQYLQWLRMNHAVDLLQNSAKSAKEVAEELQFSDPAAFSRSVKRAFGIAPSRLLRREERR